jgi:hypothetical protein
LREDGIRPEAVASSASEAIPDMAYEIIDAVMARAIQADVARVDPLFAWILMRDLPEHW